MKRKLFSFFASVITAIMLTACAAAPENKPASSAALPRPVKLLPQLYHPLAMPTGSYRRNMILTR